MDTHEVYVIIYMLIISIRFNMAELSFQLCTCTQFCAGKPELIGHTAKFCFSRVPVWNFLISNWPTLIIIAVIAIIFLTVMYSSESNMCFISGQMHYQRPSYRNHNQMPQLTPKKKGFLLEVKKFNGLKNKQSFFLHNILNSYKSFSSHCLFLVSFCKERHTHSM